jgi:endonuclease/exonuclease/phosphatase family metal-dependent hydrolase
VIRFARFGLMATSLWAAFAFAAGAQQSAQLLPAIFRVPRQIRSFPAKGNMNSIPIMTWNIDHGAKLDTIASELKKRPAGVCLLQEVDWNAARSGDKDVTAELARRLHLNAVFGVEFQELSQEHMTSAYVGQATLTQLPIQNSRILRFERQSGFWKPHTWIPSSLPIFQRRRGNRMALVTELEFGGRLLVIYNAHLESRSFGPIQAEQIDEMVADAEHYPAGTAIVLGGDLNTKYLPSTFLHKLENAGFRSATGERIDRTHKIAMALDWIFVKGPVKLQDGQVRRDFKGSDHYPVYARLLAE